MCACERIIIAGTHAHMLSLHQLSTLSISLELHLHVETTSSGRVEQVSGTHVNNIQLGTCYVKIVIETAYYWAFSAQLNKRQILT